MNNAGEDNLIVLFWLKEQLEIIAMCKEICVHCENNNNNAVVAEREMQKIIRGQKNRETFRRPQLVYVSCTEWKSTLQM